VRLIGDTAHPSAAVIVFDKSAGTAGGTFKSATVNVLGDNFYAEGVTFQNDFSKRNPEATQGTQAVALAVHGDRAIFRRVRLMSAQDTLFAAAKSCDSDNGPCALARQYFDDCYIEGNVDFIFGDSRAVFRNCESHAIAHKTVYLTAQSKRYPDQQSRYVFEYCKVTADPGVQELYLGRPWRLFRQWCFCTPISRRKSCPQDGTHSIRLFTPSITPAGPEQVQALAIRIRISSPSRRRRSSARQIFYAAAMAKIQRSSRNGSRNTRGCDRQPTRQPYFITTVINRSIPFWAMSRLKPGTSVE
jgi:hypothetical protein